MSTDTARPRIIMQGNLYLAEIDGKTVSSPSLEALQQRVGIADSEQVRARKAKAERDAEVARRKAEGEAEFRDLRPRLDAALVARDQAWQTLVTEALEGGPTSTDTPGTGSPSAVPMPSACTSPTPTTSPVTVTSRPADHPARSR